jgi:hypothetical protein
VVSYAPWSTRSDDSIACNKACRSCDSSSFGFCAVVPIEYGTCMAHVWHMYGTCMAHVWHMDCKGFQDIRTRGDPEGSPFACWELGMNLKLACLLDALGNKSSVKSDIHRNELQRTYFDRGKIGAVALMAAFDRREKKEWSWLGEWK